MTLPSPRLALALLASGLLGGVAQADPVIVPEPLKPWVDWVLWNEDSRQSPSPFNDPSKALSSWPTRLEFRADATSGSFDLGVTVYSTSWIALPGGIDAWPLNVKANGTSAPVVERENSPSVRLRPGTYRIEGTYQWHEIPQRVAIPKTIGVLSLFVDGKTVESPTWDASGELWLKRRSAAEETDRDFLGVKIFSLLEDGIPVWLRSEIELSVSGKSREEQIGTILPEGWQLASVASEIPVAVDAEGNLKAQIRAGRWTVRVSAFRADNPSEIAFAASAKPPVTDELIAFRASPDLRLVDIVGAPSVDVSQTTFPAQWRELPVFRWEISTPLRIEERLRGMGLQQAEGLQIAREWWLDESGQELTFRDRVSGSRQNIWRLDAASGQNLGSVRSGGDGQLITRNPATGAPGVEIRTRNIDLEATGTMQRSRELSATGWQTDAGNVAVTLNLPPGWRLYALLGADWVRGDWLTAWTLLDLFVLLIFALAVSRLWGAPAAILAFVAFALSYHEPEAPRYIWLALLIPLALLRVVKSGWGLRFLNVWKWATVVALIFTLAPFVASQIQQAIYPQLEMLPRNMPAFSGGRASPASVAEAMPMNAPQDANYDDAISLRSKVSAYPTKPDKSNLLFDPKARIQTGPGIPEWAWRTVTFGWSGPVLASQNVRPVLISLALERVLTILRVALLLALAGVLLSVTRWTLPFFKKSPVILLALLLLSPAAARAEFPDPALLDTLRARLLTPDDAFPNAAEIPSGSLSLNGNKIVIEADIQCALRTAVPLPGTLSTWSPLSVSVNGKPESVLRRDDGNLWIALPEGVHKVRIEGLLPDVTEWQWTFLLKPRLVSVDAPDWNVTGVRPNGVPEQQIFLARKQKTTGPAATFDRQDLASLVAVDRRIELGLIWQTRTTVTRISPPGNAVSLRIPILPGENVLTSNISVKDGSIDVRLGANDTAVSWESELPPMPSISLVARDTDSWIERWTLVASPVWNVAISGLAPTFESNNAELVPVWHPWPGESAELSITRPEAIPGETITVSNAVHETMLGNRQRTSTLNLSLRCSLGADFPIELPPGATVTSLTHDGRAIPVRVETGKLIVPVRPGEQTLTIAWKEDIALGFRTTVGAIRLPVASANVNTIVRVPENRWVLATHGPLRGPAVRFWTVLACSLLAAWALSRMRVSQVGAVQWMLLAIGLTQVPLVAALTVVAWLLLLEWRGRPSVLALPNSAFNSLQILLIALTAASLIILLVVVASGLLGSPDMFIRGNNSTQFLLQWYAPQSGELLPTPISFSLSIWWYRLLMLVWALWLAATLIGWLSWGWKQFSSGGCFRGKPKTVTPPPPLPTA